MERLTAFETINWLSAMLSANTSSHIKRFAIDFLILFSGNSIALCLTLLSYPIISRIYSVEEFGVFSLIVSTLAILIAGAAGRYEVAIMLPKIEKNAFIIFEAAVIFTIIFCTFIFVIISIPSLPLEQFRALNDIDYFFLIIPIALFFATLFRAQTYLLSRLKKFQVLSIVRVSQSATLSFLQILLGLTHPTAFTLILSQILSHIIASMVCLFAIRKPYPTMKIANRLKRQYISFKSYRSFPLYSAPASVANAAGEHLPLFFILHNFGITAAGAYGIVMRTIAAPASLIAVPLSQLLLQRITYARTHNPEYVFRIIIFFGIGLLALTVVPAGIIHFFGEILLNWFLGAEWSQAGKIATIIIFSIAIKFIVSPITVVLTMKDNHKYAEVWKIVYLITLFIVLLVASKLSFEHFLILYVLHDLLLYCVYLLLVIRSAFKISTNG